MTNSKAITLHRGSCVTCGWRGRRVTNEATADMAQARHWRRNQAHRTGVLTWTREPGQESWSAEFEAMFVQR